ncbi:MAG TPA: hypothetical protein VK487_01265 [Candidatus Bathyarchaeia archaeon]|nr:hypothetical protein [Candidatus Bathyarchaeia archaeon]
MSVPLPPTAANWWSLFYTYLFFGLIAGVTTISLMVYFVLKHRVRLDEKVEYQAPEKTESKWHNRFFAIFFILMIALLVALAFLSYPSAVTLTSRSVTPGAVVIEVSAFQWDFEFIYPNGAMTIGYVYVPTGTPIVFNVTSVDVNHSFDIPDFKVQVQAIPGRFNLLPVEAPTVPGVSETNYTIQCLQLCGIGHTYMKSVLVAMDPSDFAKWYANSAPRSSKTTVVITLYAGEISSSEYGFGNSSMTITSPGPTFNVNVNDTVMILFANAGTIHHSFEVINSLTNSTVLFDSALAAPVQSGGFGSITFTANQTGSFYYISPVNNDAALGMWGHFNVLP